MDVYSASQGDEIARLKHLKFSHEQEVRIITFNHVHRGCLNPDGSAATAEQQKGIHTFDPDRKGFYLKCNLHTLMESIYVSPLASPSFGDLIKRLVRRYPIQVPVRLAGVQF
jgi:hypothetical protein